MNVGFVVDDLGPTQLSFLLIKSLNEINNINISPFIFYNNLAMTPVAVNFACMNVGALCHFNGELYATSIDTAKQVLMTSNNCSRNLFLWDLEWLRKKMDYMENLKVLRNKNLRVWARSEFHKNLIEKYANISVATLDIEKLWKKK